MPGRPWIALLDDTAPGWQRVSTHLSIPGSLADAFEWGVRFTLDMECAAYRSHMVALLRRGARETDSPHPLLGVNTR